MQLIQADTSALWHAEILNWNYARARDAWLDRDDAGWLSDVLQRCPILKFPMPFATVLDTRSASALLDGQNTISTLFHTILGKAVENPEFRLPASQWVAPWGNQTDAELALHCKGAREGRFGKGFQGK